MRFALEEGGAGGGTAPVCEFLRYLDIDFTLEELGIPTQVDDVDVRFRGARFHNVGRTAHDVASGHQHSVAMGIPELVREVLKALQAKSHEAMPRASLDALVCMDLCGRHLHSPSDVIEHDTSAVAELGWRSVSVLWPPYAVVVCAKPAAPQFLRARARRVFRYLGMPREVEGVPVRPSAMTSVAATALASVTVVGYVALGGLVLAGRTLGAVIDTVGASLGLWQPRVAESSDELTERLAGLF